MSATTSLDAIVEQVAARVHDEWMAAQRRAGRVGAAISRDTGLNLMVPYAELHEADKDLDRTTVRAVLTALAELGLVVVERHPQTEGIR